jgi:hypothetical protein
MPLEVLSRRLHQTYRLMFSHFLDPSKESPFKRFMEINGRRLIKRVTR